MDSSIRTVFQHAEKMKTLTQQTPRPPGAVNPGRKDKAMRNILRMWYYLPGQSEIFSEPQMFETRDGKAWERAVSIAHEKGYKIVKVERVK